MKRIQYHRYGGPDEMRLEEFDPGNPEKGQILVRVKAAAVNHIDLKTRNGVVKLMTGKRFPRAMGTDFAGIVEAIGPGVTRFKPGDAVVGTTSIRASGAFAEGLVTEEARAVGKPSSLSFEQAAALPMVGTTAWTGLMLKAHLKAGQTVFIHGCLGGVGRAAVQLADLVGGHVAGSCRGGALAEARALGVNPVFDFQRLDLRSLKGRYDVVFDTAGTLSLGESGSLLKLGGVALHINPSLVKTLGILVSPRHKLVIANRSTEILAHVLDTATVGRLSPAIGGTVGLSQAIPALTALEHTGSPKGKLLIIPG